MQIKIQHNLNKLNKIKNMANKIFVSYKYADSNVHPLNLSPHLPYIQTTARHYVNLLESKLEDIHIYKGENDGEDLGDFRDETIESRLREKIFDSSITIVLISKGMQELGVLEKDQWIPWEISYSLRRKKRSDRISVANGMLAVVIPDENNSYDYFIEHSSCPHCKSIRWKIENLFPIIQKNMFNRKKPNQICCSGSFCDSNYHVGDDHSYIHPVKWENFIYNISGFIDLVSSIKESIDDYNICRIIE